MHICVVVGRTEPMIGDVELTFQDMGISVSELIDYVAHVEPMKCAVEKNYKFPKPCQNQLRIPEELGQVVPKNREEHILELST